MIEPNVFVRVKQPNMLKVKFNHETTITIRYS
jgi:hypothetical protein